MNAKAYETMLKKYGSGLNRLAPEVRHDMRTLLDFINVQNRTIGRLTEEMRGATQTMLAITKAVGGVVELPFKLIDSLDPRDSLSMADLKTPTGEMYKRFEFEPAPPLPEGKLLMDETDSVH